MSIKSLSEEPLDPLDLDSHLKDKKWGANLLRQISIFAYFHDDELAELFALGRTFNQPAKSNAVIEGESSRGLFIILSGKVSVYKRDVSSNRLLRLTYLEPGASFGELSLFDDAPRSATITAESNCILFSLEQKGFQDYLNKKGDHLKARFYQKCAEEMTERFRKQNDDYIVSQHLLWKHALRRDSQP